jgi:hypothetical protein
MVKVKVNHWGRIHHVIALSILSGGTLMVSGALDGCQNPASAIDVGVRIAEDVCKEVPDDSGLPDWVTLACDVVGGIPGQKAKVLMPRMQWAARRPCPPCNDAGLPSWESGKSGK